MNIVYKLLYLLFRVYLFLLHQSFCSISSNHYSFLTNLSYSRCDNEQSYQNVSGQEIFKSSDMGTLTVNSITLSGWFFFRGYNPFIYNIFTLYSSSNILFKVGYQVATSQIIQSTLLSTTVAEPFPSIQKNSWYFIYSTISYTSSQLQLITTIEMGITIPFTSSTLTEAYPGPFQKQDIIVSIGNFVSTTSVRQGCTFSRNIKIYWDDQLNIPSPRSYYNDILSFNTKLIWNFDFFYYFNNNGFLQNIEQPMNLLQIGIQNSGLFSIPTQKSFLTDYINISELDGFTISFHVKINNPAFSNNIRILSIEYISTLTTVDFLSSGNIGLNSSYVTGVQFNQWIQITVIAKVKNQLEIYLFVKGKESQTQKITLVNNPQPQLPQLEFGSITNTESIQINHLRVYQGTFLTQINNNNCYLQASKSQCISCNTGYLLDYQNDQLCVSPSITNTSTLIDNVRDWQPIRVNCPKDMIMDPQSNVCKCKFQYYEYNSQCLKCPKYCRGCYNFDNCIKQDPVRLDNGLCPSDTFDDGYSCLKDKLKILSLQNYQLYNPTLYNLGAYCSLTMDPTSFQIKNDVLRMTGKDSFFFSFVYKSTLPSYQRGSIWYLRDGSTDLFTVMYNRTSNALVELFVLGSYTHYFNVNNNEPVWIGLWTDLQKAVFMVHTNAQLLYKEFVVNIQFLYTNPLICTGPCLSNDDNYCCGDFGNYPQSYVYRMGNPIKDIMEVQNLMFLSTVNLAKFQTDMNDSTSASQFNDPSSGLVLDFQSTPFTIDKVKGYGINPQTSAVISGVNIQKLLPTFSTFININKIQYQTSLVSYNPKVGMQVEYFIVPYGTRVQIRICIFISLLDCKDSNYSMLNMNENNHLMIIPRLRSVFSTDITYIDFEIVCNKQREILKYVMTYQNLSTTPIDINIVKQSVPAGDFDISLNNLSIDQGNGSYYFDYTSDQKCFLFQNLNSMSCLEPKDGYVLYEGKAISEEECKSYSKVFHKLFIINEATRRCVKLNLEPTCHEPDLTTNPTSCKACLYSNALQENNCQCLDGTYSDINQLKCIPCNVKCSTCEGSADNCITCKYANQLAPSCGCIESNMFIDVNGQCQYCSSRCSTCDFDPNNCITCAEKRLNPPECGCDILYYQEKNNQCENIICSNKCKSCQNNADNCISCKSGRSNPPNCSCDLNHYEVFDGSCLPCPSGSFYDKTTSSCQQCEKPCLQCANTKDQCIACEEGLLLDRNNCMCSNQGLTAAYVDGKYLCLRDMDVQLQVVFRQSYYLLVFIFDYDLTPINFSNPKRLGMLIELSLSEIPTKHYELVNPEIRGNKLYTKLSVKSSFQCKFGQVRFLVNSSFISLSHTYVLSVNYKYQPIQFELGPYLFSEEILDQKEVGVVIDSLKNEHQQLLSTIQQTQFIFYFLNTAQPTLLFLLLKANLPPNLYAFYQVFGIMVFPDVVDYQTTNYKNNFNLVTTQLEGADVTISDQKIYRRLGLSNSFLVNAPIVILKYFSLVFLILFLKMIVFYLPFSQSIKNKLIHLKYTIIQRINSENESNLLILSLSILVQFANTNEDRWAVRYGYYLSIACLFMFAISFFYNLKELNNRSKNAKLYYSIMFTDRLQKSNSFFGRNYFLFQMVKKYCVILVLFAFRELPFYACSINGIIFFLSCIQTFVLKPYKLFLSRVIKILGDFILSIVWFLHIFLIRIESDLYKQTIFDQRKVEQYLNIGYLTILLLLIFNIIFLFEYIQTLFILIKNLFKKKSNTLLTSNQTFPIQQRSPLMLPTNILDLTIQEIQKRDKSQSQMDRYITSFLPESQRKKYAKNF